MQRSAPRWRIELEPAELLGTPSVRMPTASARAISGGSRSSGVISHSRRQSLRMNGMTTSSTNWRQLCRIKRCSSESCIVSFLVLRLLGGPRS
jgi:hypothetical protein